MLHPKQKTKKRTKTKEKKIIKKVEKSDTSFVDAWMMNTITGVS